MKDKPENTDPQLHLTQYLDGQLDAGERRQVQRELETNPALLAQAKLYEALERQLDALATAPVPGVDYDLQRQHIMESIERKMLLSPRPAASLFFRPVFRVAAIAAMAIFAVSLYLHFVPRSATSPMPPFSTPTVGTSNGGIEVSILQHRASASQVEVEYLPTKLDQFPLVGPHQQQVAQAPPGTVIASFNQPRANRAAADVLMFLPTESSADSGDIK
jgi:anti-sigma factor RsiW